MTDIIHEEEQYLNLIRIILKEGTREETRNGVTMSIFGHSMRFSLKNGTIPLITTKKTAWKTCLKELLFFIRGETDNRILKEQGVNIWNANSTRKFLDERGLSHYPEDCLGPIYGFQWRNWNGSYNIQTETHPQTHTHPVKEIQPQTQPQTHPLKETHPQTHLLKETQTKKANTGAGIDQLANIITSLKNPQTRTSRRLILSAWNPEQIGDMALPPCHVMAQFNVKEDKYLSCCLFQRSGDVGLGVPFNIASYAFLTHIMAKHCGLVADEFVYFLGNAHIYEEHIETLQRQIERPPHPFPAIEIVNLHESIDDYCVEDVRFVKEYVYHSALKMEMKA
jgi:thymidylate synthase